MRRISAQYILPVSSPPLKQGIVEFEDNGTIIGLIDTGGRLKESAKLEYFDGVIVPGFVLPACRPLPGNPNSITFSELDARLRKNGIRGAGILIGAEPMEWFRGMQESTIRYHGILELCPGDDEEFMVFQEAVSIISNAWNEYHQPGSITCCQQSWFDTELPPYLLEYISTHRSLLTLSEDWEFPLPVQALALNQAWEKLREDCPEPGHILPGHLVIMGGIPEEQIKLQEIQAFHFTHPGEFQNGTADISFVKDLFKMQSEAEKPGLFQDTEISLSGLQDILPSYTIEAARAIFEDIKLGSLEPGKIPGINLISGIEYTPDGIIRLSEKSSLKVLH